MKKLMATAVLLFIVPAWASAQNTDDHYRGQGYVLFGLGTGTRPCFNAPGLDYCFHPLFKAVGGGGEGFLYQGLGLGAELGYANWGGYDNQAWIASGDLSYHLRRRAARGIDPFVLAGASLIVPTHKGGGRGDVAPNFGGGANLWLAKHAALRVEFRDIAAANFWSYDQYLSFRVGLTFR
ncbi:MAG: hypothetical protein ACLQOO_27030 [Terriglobia bacterium]